MKIPNILVFVILLFSFSPVYGELVLDIEMYETYFESSNFYSLINKTDTSRKFLDGFITITNNDRDQSLQDVLLELENDYLIEEINYHTGKEGFISKKQPDLPTFLFTAPSASVDPSCTFPS